MHIGKIRAAMGAVAMCLGVAFSAQAADQYPAKPVKIIVPYTPGAINDVLARAMGAELSEELGQTAIVENRPGAGSVIGTNYVAKSNPDGYTILQVPAAYAINAALRSDLPYDSVKDFDFVALAATSPFLLIVKADSEYKTVADLVNKAKQNPGKLSFASTGNGGNAHMMGEMLRGLAGIDVLHVPYKGAAQAITDLVGGQLDFTFSTYTGASAVLKGGLVRALAITGNKRSPSFAQIPTIAESGYPDYNAAGWWAYAVPAGTPKPVVDKLNKAINKTLSNPDFAKRFAAEGLDITGGTPEAATKFIHDDIAVWKRVVKEFHINLQGN